MSRSRRLAYTVFAIAVLVIADHVSKWIAISYLKNEGTVHEFLWGMFRLQYAENTGAFLSLGANLPAGMRELVMIGLNAVILTGLIIYLATAKQVAAMIAIALTCIAGGGIGNMIDRLFRDGRVVDFMNMGLPPEVLHLRTGIFNIADVAIMAGLFLIIGNELYALKKSPNNKGIKDNP